ncbi:Transport and Golgi organization protein 2 [Desmophyllum pertusum]|uniref:Transport and Golgi organization protein 2 n=1 Tax=Desmophyllum pertusum TaxID=174260 RepID=A0A9X0CE23_9CNID|nr:Transport and Golgi organization protein 2 [Desmophyllum pertusum]
MYGYVGLCGAMYGYVGIVVALMYGYVGLCGTMYGYVGLCGTMYGYVGLCGAVYGYVGLCGAMYGYVGLCGAMYGYVGLCGTMYGYVGLCGAMYGYVGLCCAMYGYVGLCGAMYGYRGLCGAVYGYVGLCGAMYGQAPKFFGPSTIGRGYLVPDFLKGDGNVESYLKTVSGQSEKYHGFNLLVGKLSQTDETKVGWYCNIEDKQVTMMEPGIHVLSNKVLDCPWIKMDYGRKRFAKILEENPTKKELIDELMDLLTARERHFSVAGQHSFIGPQDEGSDMNMINASRAVFVNYKEKTFGTRTNTVVLVDANGHATYVERTMDEDGTDPDEAEWGLNTFEFDLIQQETGDCEDHVTNDHVTNDNNNNGF